jgi:hypothetical protein
MDFVILNTMERNNQRERIGWITLCILITISFIIFNHIQHPNINPVVKPPQQVPNIIVLHKETYLQNINNSVGSKIFNSMYGYFRDTGETKDFINDGEFACAYFVSSILTINEAMVKPFTTVDGLKKVMGRDKKWFIVPQEQIEAGDVIFFRKSIIDDGSENAHVGFAQNEKDVVSTNYKIKEVDVRPIRFQDIDVVYRYMWSN